MGNIHVLDCTLRDGGYCNQWAFGKDNIKKIIAGLTKAGIDIIECGFLTNNIIYNKNVSKFTSVNQISKMLPTNRKEQTFVCMVNYGEYDLENIPTYDGSSIDGIRVAFHKKDMIPALEFCKGVKAKGYKVFIQAMVSLNYKDEEFLDLINRVNQVNPYAFYIVDSFGVMKRNDLIRLFYMVENNLKRGVTIGYHSHNNMQLAYSNAQTLTDIKTHYDIILDSSVFGMGRGAGNLNSELLVEYLNDSIGATYKLKPLLAIIDGILSTFYQQNYWGYSLPNYLSAKYNTHPNYAGYLEAKRTLTVEDMDAIFSMMDNNKRFTFDKNYIEELYVKYLTQGSVSEEHLLEFKEYLLDKDVLIIAPGTSSLQEKDKIVNFSMRPNVITISVNFDYTGCETDFIFISNLRRYRELDKSVHKKCIASSNIDASNCYLRIDYKKLLNDVDFVKDNAGLMLIKLLIDLGIKNIFLAGFDGYSIDASQNFAVRSMSFYATESMFTAMNTGINQVLRNYSKQTNIVFLTNERYISLSY